MEVCFKPKMLTAYKNKYLNTFFKVFFYDFKLLILYFNVEGMSTCLRRCFLSFGHQKVIIIAIQTIWK